MPNWCENDLFVYGPGLLKVAKAVEGRDDVRLQQGFLHRLLHLVPLGRLDLIGVAGLLELQFERLQARRGDEVRMG